LGIKVGTLIDGTARFWENEPWRKVVTREFNLGVITPLWHGVIPQKDKIDFSWPDLQIGFAQSAKLAVHVESLVMSYFTPQWLKENYFTHDQLLEMYTRYCRRVVEHYKGKVKSWSAVIEAGFAPPYDSTDFWFQRLGKQYIDLACEILREIDPTAKIIYGDSGNFTQNGPKYRHTKNIIDHLLEKGLVDGVGIEMDWDAAKTPPLRKNSLPQCKAMACPCMLPKLLSTCEI
jgi:endo-1,4-beta-xylanase